MAKTKKDGDHTITKNGPFVVAIPPHKDFEKFKKPQNTLSDFLAESPFAICDLELEREKDIGREIEL